MRQFIPAYTEVDEGQAETLSTPPHLYTVEVKPPRDSDLPETLEGFVRGILEIQTGLLKLKNRSPVVVYEIQRFRPDRLRIQYLTTLKRLERKVRTHLATEIPGIGFDTGVRRLPLEAGDSAGGGILTTGRKSRYPLETVFDSPPINGVVASLHRDSMRDTKFVVQVVFQPVAGQPLRERWRKRQGFKTVGFLRREKSWGDRSATPRERRQADAVERKMGQRRFWVSIRFAVVGAGEYTPSRVKELGGAFNRFESGETGQYLDINTIRGVRQKRFLELYRAINSRTFGGYSLRFQASVEELAGLVSLPSIDQDNIHYARP